MSKPETFYQFLFSVSGIISTMSFTPRTSFMTTWVPTGIVTASSADLAVHSWPSMTAAPDGAHCCRFLITFALLPISPSTFVFTVSRLTNRIASGLVKRRRTDDDQNTTAASARKIQYRSKNANTARPQNQIVVSAMVAASIRSELQRPPAIRPYPQITPLCAPLSCRLKHQDRCSDGGIWRDSTFRPWGSSPRCLPCWKLALASARFPHFRSRTP